MKTPPARIAFGALAAAVAIAAVILPRATGQPRSSLVQEWKPQESLLPAVQSPRHPPTAYLGFTDPAGSRQEGTIVHYDWVIDGKPRSYQLPPPIPWPPTLSGPAPLLVEIAAQAPPQSLQLRLYERTTPTGIPRGRGIARTCTLSAPVAGSCAITRHGAVWQAAVDGIRPGRAYYVAASAMWFIPSTVPQPRATARASEVAAWLFHIETS